MRSDDGEQGACGGEARSPQRRASRGEGVEARPDGQGVSQPRQFSAITAEEEAATAVFKALQRQSYPDAQHILWRKHTHRAALWPFMESLGEFMTRGAEGMGISFTLWRSQDTVPKLDIRILVPNRPGVALRSGDGPLALQVDVNGRAPDFVAELQQLVSLRRATSIKKLIEQRANLRNQLLYAAKAGIPRVRLNEGGLEKAETRTFAFLTLFLLIDQTDGHQAFAADAVRAFVKLLGRIDRLVERRTQSEVDPYWHYGLIA